MRSSTLSNNGNDCENKKNIYRGDSIVVQLQTNSLLLLRVLKLLAQLVLICSNGRNSGTALVSDAGNVGISCQRYVHWYYEQIPTVLP